MNAHARCAKQIQKQVQTPRRPKDPDPPTNPVTGKPMKF